MGFLGLLVSLGGMFHGLLRGFVSALVIFLAVVRRSGTMSMCGKVVEFGGSLVRIICHD